MSLSLAELEQQLLEVARVGRRATKPVAAPQKLGAATEILQDATASATGCLHAVFAICSPQARAWEPESIWLTLDRRNVDVPVVNRDKIMAALTLTMMPSFWWDLHVFENTVLAFNNVVSNAAVVQEATPGQIAWGVYEAELLFASATQLAEDDDNSVFSLQEEPEFDREPVLYTATVLQRAGYLCAPELLKFAQRELDQLNRSGAEVSRSTVSNAWAEFKKQKPMPVNSLGETALDVQLGRLASVELHVQERLTRYKADTQRLR